jgi:excisionase family DNA binding protein
MPGTDDRELLTLAAAAMRLGISAPTVRRLVAQGLLPAVGTSPDLRVRLADVEARLAVRPPAAA